MNRILVAIATLLLALLPFFPLPENLMSLQTQVGNENFMSYLITCAGIMGVGVGLALYMKPARDLSGWLLFSIGLLSLVPLHLGPPRTEADLLNFSVIEKFRFASLMVAVLIFVAGGFLLASPLKSNLNKVFAAALAGTLGLGLWDHYSSLRFSDELANWVADGKNAGYFFPQYDFNIVMRTLARTSIYAATILAAWICFKNARIKKWHLALLAIFSLLGIVFGLSYAITEDPVFYILLVPAVVFAPGYWLGMAMLFSKQNQPRESPMNLKSKKGS